MPAGESQIAVGPAPAQVCPPLGKGTTVTVYNADILNVVTVSRSRSISQNGTNGAPIQPLTSAVLDASTALYAVAPQGTAPLVLLPQGGSMSPSPAQIATQISALGLMKDTTGQAINASVGALPVGIAETGAPLQLGSTETPAAGASWGPYTFAPANQSGGSYLLAITPTTPANISITDVTIQHLDASSNVVYTEFFTLFGGNYSPVIDLPNPTLIRGNFYGASISVTGLTATSAQVNTMLGSGGLFASGITLRCYLMPYFAADPEPKVINGSPTIGSFGGVTPGGLLYTTGATAFTITPSSSSVPTPLVPYAGPATVVFEETGVTTTPSNAKLNIGFWTVAAGNVGNMAMNNGQAAAQAIGPIVWPADLPGCVALLTLTNADATQTANFRVVVTAGNSA